MWQGQVASIIASGVEHQRNLGQLARDLCHCSTTALRPTVAVAPLRQGPVRTDVRGVLG
jgi:hypothetical protein